MAPRRASRVSRAGYKHEGIRTSPVKLNLIAKLVRRLWVPEALAQLEFSPKRHAPTVAAALEKCAARAAQQHEVVPEELEVDRAFVTPAPFMKRAGPRGMVLDARRGTTQAFASWAAAAPAPCASARATST